MKFSNNVGTLDRGIRILVAEILLLLSIFWVYGIVQVVLFIFSVIILATAVTKFCGLYSMFGISTCPAYEKPVTPSKSFATIATVVAIAVLGCYSSMFLSKKIFLEDYNRMNYYYKQTLFYTGQSNRSESISKYVNLVKEYDVFYQKYSKYRPYVIWGDENFNTDVANVRYKIASLESTVVSGDLTAAHKDLEGVRTIFQDILKRNGFSMLSVYLVDFHDVMEKFIDAANAKNASGVLSTYQEVNDKLRAVEGVANDDEIQTIRKMLEQVTTSARIGNVEVLPSQAADLKSSFVKVYLKRG